ncbi:hypothetical protein B0A48_16755 [Cryoendolithus antarcticus]|uniref:F-box domain-containing protein n=1 Tax=Cryoendolithus antarcticus TaxID=1507870 RepID=A0A1V8SDG3_9PEZI|nr:hypothetical protein B0A48_16755 [Cryoendolithus antarcticus]
MSDPTPEPTPYNAAAQKVFAIVELLAMILLDEAIPDDQLYPLQQVNRDTYYPIRGCPALVRKMFSKYKLPWEPKAPVQFSPIFAPDQPSHPHLRQIYCRETVFITKPAIAKAFGGFAVGISYFPHHEGGMLQIGGRSADGERNDVDSSAIVGSWGEMSVASRALVATVKSCLLDLSSEKLELLCAYQNTRNSEADLLYLGEGGSVSRYWNGMLSVATVSRMGNTQSIQVQAATAPPTAATQPTTTLPGIAPSAATTQPVTALPAMAQPVTAQSAAMQHAAPQTAGQRFFGTDDLVDLVVLDDVLEPRDLFALRRVNATFRTALQQPPLRRRMWLERARNLPIDARVEYNFLLMQDLTRLTFHGTFDYSYLPWSFPAHEVTRHFAHFQVHFFRRPLGDVLLIRGERYPDGRQHRVNSLAVVIRSWTDVLIANVPVRASRVQAGHGPVHWPALALPPWQEDIELHLRTMGNLWAAFDQMPEEYNGVVFFANHDVLVPRQAVRMVPNDGSGRRDSGAGWS